MPPSLRVATLRIAEAAATWRPSALVTAAGCSLHIQACNYLNSTHHPPTHPTDSHLASMSLSPNRSLPSSAPFSANRAPSRDHDPRPGRRPPRLHTPVRIWTPVAETAMATGAESTPRGGPLIACNCVHYDAQIMAWRVAMAGLRSSGSGSDVPQSLRPAARITQLR
ncbi:hypothetical protein DENSPDRAFT_926218 [Dentipellis sp. KUC8613]|nr:hypothetical protein DENSPDRAFT_926218 [Dentipellis sp. KUC8613]